MKDPTLGHWSNLRDDVLVGRPVGQSVGLSIGPSIRALIFGLVFALIPILGMSTLLLQMIFIEHRSRPSRNGPEHGEKVKALPRISYYGKHLEFGIGHG